MSGFQRVLLRSWRDQESVELVAVGSLEPGWDAACFDVAVSYTNWIPEGEGTVGMRHFEHVVCSVELKNSSLLGLAEWFDAGCVGSFALSHEVPGLAFAGDSDIGLITPAETVGVRCVVQVATTATISVGVAVRPEQLESASRDIRMVSAGG